LQTNSLETIPDRKFEHDLKVDLDKAISDKDVNDIYSFEIKYSEPKAFNIDEDLEFLILKSSCPVLGILCDMTSGKTGLNPAEIQVITFTFGNLENGNFIVNELLTKADVVDTRLYLKKPLRSNPMSCNKIKKLIPNITSNYCAECFSLKEIATYPNPLIHLYKKDNFSKLDAIVLRFIELSKKREEIESAYSAVLSSVIEELKKINMRERKIGNYKIFIDDENKLQLSDSGEK
jgi:hypothetical protein